jgi:DNA modification methylase
MMGRVLCGDALEELRKLPDNYIQCVVTSPPYWGTKGGNSNYDTLSDEQWKGMRDQLAGIQGKFLLSSNLDVFVMRLFRDFYSRVIDVRVTLPQQTNEGSRKEVLVANYELPRIQSKLRKKKYWQARYVGDRAPEHAKEVTETKRKRAIVGK